MFYRINKEDGYIHGVVEGVNPENANCTEAEYLEIKSLLENAPKTTEPFFYYRLKENLEWELCEFKINPENEMATETDYLSALANLGVDFNA